MVIGVANAGGFIAAGWIPRLVEALEAGLDIVSGMHARLATSPRAARAAAERLGRRLIDVRKPPAEHSGRHRAQAQGQAPADGRHRLRARQEVHRARDRARLRSARRRRDFRATGRPES